MKASKQYWIQIKQLLSIESWTKNLVILGMYRLHIGLRISMKYLWMPMFDGQPIKYFWQLFRDIIMIIKNYYTSWL